MMSCYVFHHVMFLYYTKLVCSKAIHHHLTSQFSLNSPVPCDFQDEMDYSGQVLQCETAAVMREKQHATRNQKSYWWALKSLLQVQSFLSVFFRHTSAFSLLPLFFFSSSILLQLFFFSSSSLLILLLFSSYSLLILLLFFTSSPASLLKLFLLYTYFISSLLILFFTEFFIQQYACNTKF